MLLIIPVLLVITVLVSGLLPAFKPNAIGAGKCSAPGD
jgi:hypothetical protein